MEEVPGSIPGQARFLVFFLTVTAIASRQRVRTRTPRINTESHAWRDLARHLPPHGGQCSDNTHRRTYSPYLPSVLGRAQLWRDFAHVMVHLAYIHGAGTFANHDSNL
ncbi:hypothetical protein SCLCIDRAFT_27687 [Scleroderma citrinum Foug A]|uniref:Uncharacterized protein n=1 Tax=Scleroderma citrinum Foug A TaxID=1036808 RepID=A0A0C3DSK0_9AGAM|nr:hypothetical protein SCLCIDRAFT_27687 [Scleroderma citrinum Foug A]